MANAAFDPGGFFQFDLAKGMIRTTGQERVLMISEDVLAPLIANAVASGDLTALRYKDWKLVFMEQQATVTMRVWQEPFVPLRLPLIENLRRDPYERATITSNTYYDWMLDRVFLMVPAQKYVGKFLQTFKEFPPSQKPASFSLKQVMEKMTSPGAQ